MKLVATDRRARKVTDGVAVVHESAPGGMRKIRCPATHQLAVTSRSTDGSTVLRTPGGVTYVTKRLGR